MSQIEIDMSGLTAFSEELKAVNHDTMMREAANTLAQVYLSEAKRNTPVAGNKSYTVDGKTFVSSSKHMRRSWGVGNVSNTGNIYEVEIYNSASYASYVNDGHRQTPGRFVPILGKRLVKSFVLGLHMADKAERLTTRKSDNVLNTVVSKYTKGLQE